MDRKTHNENTHIEKKRAPRGELYMVNTVTDKNNIEKPRTREELQMLLSIEIKKNQVLTDALTRATSMDVDF